MIPNRVSIIVPSRNERYLPQTVADLLAKAADDVEVIAVLDGYWPDPPLPDDPRLVVLHRGQARGMRPGINAAARIATGGYLLKIDAHCLVGEGYDAILKADCDGDWVVVPRRYSLDAERWAIQETGKSPVDAHYLSFPFERPDDPSCGLHGTVWRDRARARIDVLVDDEMSSQGSCWFTTRGHWDRIGEMEPAKYGNFIQEMQEIGLKTWLGGGALKVNKKTFYAHLHKGKTYEGADGRKGRGYFIASSEQQRGSDFAIDYWMHDRWPDRVRDLAWLVERFWPVPGWPDDWRAVADRMRRDHAVA